MTVFLRNQEKLNQECIEFIYLGGNGGLMNKRQNENKLTSPKKLRYFVMYKLFSRALFIRVHHWNQFL